MKTLFRWHRLQPVFFALMLMAGCARPAFAQTYTPIPVYVPSNSLPGMTPWESLITAINYRLDGALPTACTGISGFPCGSGGGGISGSTAPVGFDFVGAPVAGSKEAITCIYALNVPANFTTPTTQATCGTDPSESDIYTLKINGSAVGTITLSSSCAVTLGTATATTCAVGQRLELDAPPTTVSGADISITLAVTR